LKCDEIRDRLTEFLDNEVSDIEHQAIQSHLDDCAGCADELDSLREFLTDFRRLKSIEPSRDWDSELNKKLTKAQRPAEVEIEILRSAVIGLSQRVQKLEEMKGYIPPTLDGEIMSVEELARYLRMSVEKVFEIIDQIPKFRVGYEYRFVRASVDQWIRSLEQDPYQQQDNYWSDWNKEER
jgi:excisionase family DNA binding protein